VRTRARALARRAVGAGAPAGAHRAGPAIAREALRALTYVAGLREIFLDACWEWNAAVGHPAPCNGACARIVGA